MKNRTKKYPWRWYPHAVKFRQTTNHILLTNTEKQKETRSKKQENREKKLQLAKTGIGQKDNTKEFIYYTVTKGYHYAYPDWECEKGRYSTHVIHLITKQKLQPQSIREQKKKCSRGKRKQEKCNQLTRVNAKNMKGVKHKRNMITQHQPREKKKTNLF